MKKLLLIVLFGFFVSPLAMASGLSLFNNEPIPKQSYQSAEDGTQSAGAKSPKSLAMAKLQAIVAKAKGKPDNHALAKSSDLPPMPQAQQESTQEATHPLTNSANLSRQTIREIESQLSQLNQARLLFQQQADRRLETLANNNNVLKVKIEKLDQAVGILNQELVSLSSHVKGAVALSAASTNLQPKAKTFENRYGNSIKYLLYALLILLLVLIALFIPRRRTLKSAKSVQSKNPGVVTTRSVTTPEDDTKDEYDFMGSREAIPAKLDLARAYLAMEDYKEARKVLGQILAIGDAEQQRSAQDLISKIPANT